MPAMMRVTCRAVRSMAPISNILSRLLTTTSLNRPFKSAVLVLPYKTDSVETQLTSGSVAPLL